MREKIPARKKNSLIKKLFHVNLGPSLGKRGDKDCVWAVGKNGLANYNGVSVYGKLTVKKWQRKRDGLGLGLESKSGKKEGRGCKNTGGRGNAGRYGSGGHSFPGEKRVARTSI